jgi:hypothetical protein
MIRRLSFALAVFCMMAPASVFGQAPTTKPVSVDAMKKLDYLAGKWKGAGWIMMGPQRREEFNQTENVQSKLDGTILTIDGSGRSKPDDRPVHNAFGVIYYDAPSSEYKFMAFLADGRSVLADFKVTDNGFVWGFKAPYGQIRYTMTHTAKDEWNEIGERSADGSTWSKMFEMTLTRDK